MNTVAEAINTLISAVNVAHNKGGVYSLEESHYIFMAISYLNSLQQEAPTAEQESAPAVEPAPASTVEEAPTQESTPVVQEEVVVENSGPQQ